MIFILTVALISLTYYTFNKISNLEKQIDNLKQRDQTKQTQTSIESQAPSFHPPAYASQNQPQTSLTIKDQASILPTPPPSKPTTITTSPPHNNQSDYSTQLPTSQVNPWFEQLTSWILIDWPMKLGVLLVITGFSWLVGYAYLQDWITDTFLIIAGISIGILIALLGYWRGLHNSLQGQVIELLGHIFILITVYAGYSYYQILPWWLGLLFAYLSITGLVWSSIRYQQKYFAYTGLILGGIVPHIIGFDPNHIWPYASIISLLTVTFIYISQKQRWPILELLSLAVIAFSLLPLFEISNSTSASLDQQLYSVLIIMFTSISLFAWYAYQIWQNPQLNHYKIWGFVLTGIINLSSLILIDTNSIELNAPWMLLWASIYQTLAYYLIKQNKNSTISLISWWIGAIAFALGIVFIDSALLSNLQKHLTLITAATLWPILNSQLSSKRLVQHSLIFYAFPIFLSYLYFPQINWSQSFWQDSTIIIIFSLTSQWIITLFLYYRVRQQQLSTYSFVTTIVFMIIATVFFGLNPQSPVILQIITVITVSTIIIISQFVFKPKHSLISLLLLPPIVIIGLQHSIQLYTSSTIWNPHLLTSFISSLIVWTIAYIYRTNLYNLSNQLDEQKLQKNLTPILFSTAIIITSIFSISLGFGNNRPTEIIILTILFTTFVIFISNHLWPPKLAQISLLPLFVYPLITYEHWFSKSWQTTPWNPDFIILLTIAASF